jgi:hypothetical protein
MGRRTEGCTEMEGRDREKAGGRKGRERGGEEIKRNGGR